MTELSFSCSPCTCRMASCTRFSTSWSCSREENNKLVPRKVGRLPHGDRDPAYWASGHRLSGPAAHLQHGLNLPLCCRLYKTIRGAARNSPT